MTAALTDSALLEAWSASRARPPDERADALLACVPAHADEDLVGWPLARWHAALAALRVGRWGSLVDAVAACPCCATELEVEFDLAAVEVAEPAEPPRVGSDAERSVAFRLPTRQDVVAAAAADDGPLAIVERCVEDPDADLSRASIEAVAAAMEQADPFGALRLALACPDCEHEWEELLDLCRFIATEAEEEARSIAAEVHELALAYGWKEDEILALPAERRRLYLELVAG